MLATVASITSANRIKKRATEYGIDVRVMQTPSHLTKEGCGYSLRFEDCYKDMISEIATDLKIKIRSYHII